MKRGFPLLPILAVLPLWAGCSGSSGPKLAIDAVEDAYYAMTCAKFIACEKEAFISLLLPDEAACVDFFMDTYADEHGSMRDILAAVAAGTVNYDARAGYKCIEEQEEYSCAEFGKLDPESCRDVFSGTIADGEACEINPECVSGYCDTSHDCPGLCLPVVPQGQGCDLNAECAPGTRCVLGICQAWMGPLAAGADCEPGDNDWCGEGLFCHEVDQACTAQVAVGEPCESAGGAECVFGAICVSDAQGDSSCVVLTIAETQGAVCDNRNGIICAMHAGLSCKIDDFQAFTGTCVPTPVLGQTCFVAGQTPTMTQCSLFDQLYCDVPPGFQTDGTCVLLKQDGQPCSGDDCLGFCNENQVCESDSDSVCP